MFYNFYNIKKGDIFYIPHTDFEKRLVIIDYDISYIYYIDLNTNYTKATKSLAIIHKMSYNELNSKWIKE